MLNHLTTANVPKEDAMYLLPIELNIYNVLEVKEHLIEHFHQIWLKQNESITLDARKLTDIDASGVQLLIATYKTAAQKGIKFKMKNASHALKRTLIICGAHKLIPLAETGGSQ